MKKVIFGLVALFFVAFAAPVGAVDLVVSGTFVGGDGSTVVIEDITSFAWMNQQEVAFQTASGERRVAYPFYPRSWFVARTFFDPANPGEAVDEYQLMRWARVKADQMGFCGSFQVRKNPDQVNGKFTYVVTSDRLQLRGLGGCCDCCR